jgi:alpha-D-ribose 1-methylphosphonate 5-triphosphate diphosphatase
VHIRWETFALDQLPMVLDWLGMDPQPIIALNDHTTGSVLKGTIARKLPQMAERSGLSQDAYNARLDSVWARRDAVPAAIETAAKTAKARGNVLLAHDEASPAERRHFRELGARSSEFPLTLETAAEARRHGEQVILGAPNVVRGGSHNGALNATVAIQAGLCTCLASDYHYPSPLHAAFKLAGPVQAELGEAWKLVSANPAAAAGLNDRGTIEPGKRADLLLVDVSRAGHPEIVATFCGGRLVYATRALHFAPAAGAAA